MRLMLALLLAAASLSAKRPITHEDVWTMKRVGVPVVSPDGRWVVVGVTEPSYDAAKNASDLWIVPYDGSAPARRLTQSKGGEGDPVFSPDSRTLAFSAKREGDDAAQIYLLPLDGGEARRLTTLSTGASSPKWRPDGKAILFQSSVYPGAADDEANRKAAEERKARKYNVRTYDSFPFRHWDRWLTDQRPHIFIQELAAGAARDLLAGTKFITQPGFSGMIGPGGEDLQPVWSPDGREIIFTAVTAQDRSVRERVPSHLYRISASGGEPVAITSGGDRYSDPQFRPDGKALYASHERGEPLYSLTRLARLDWPPAAAAAPKLITGAWDRSVANVTFSADSRTAYITAEDEGLGKIFQVNADGGAVSAFSKATEGMYGGVVSAGGRAALAARWGAMTKPDNVVAIAPDGQHRLLTDFHSAQTADLDWAPPKHFWFTAKNGKRIHSLVILPPGFDPSRKYPVVIFPHGGPHNMSGDQFFFRWNYHLLTTPGYVLLMTNYTGSTGFGEKFAADIHSDILRGPAGEIEEAIDAALKEFPFLDATRQAAAGASYGGYLMNWFEGNTKRFRCLVNHAGLTDNATMWGSTDGAYYWELRNGGPVWEGGGAWRDQSPATYAGKFSTPMLVTHGERDYRVPVSQGYEIYKLLQRREVPSRLVIFPDENHWVLNGENARVHMKEVLDWLKKYL